MSWWISLVFYLWRNTLRRWLEQPMNVLSKLLVACLVGSLGAVIILASSYLGKELERRLRDKDALTAVVTEAILAENSASSLGLIDLEEKLWRDLATSSLVFFQITSNVKVNGKQGAVLCALRNPEHHGYDDTLLFLSNSRAADTSVDIELNDFQIQVFTAKRSPLMDVALQGRDVVVGSIEQLAPLMDRGFTRIVVMQAKDVESLEKIHSIVSVMKDIEGRKIYAQSGLKILEQIKKVTEIQKYVLWASTIGAGLVLGLVSGALAWMEFREERYLLSLIRSFGVGSSLLLFHAVVENCLLAVGGVLLGFGILWGLSENLELGTLQMQWLSNLEPLLQKPGQVLLLGALSGGLLSCIPVGIGLRKPLGLVLK